VHAGELDATKAAKVINYLGLSGAFDHGQNREGFARDAKLVTASLLTQFYNVYSLEEVPQIGDVFSQFTNWVGEQVNKLGDVFAKAYSWVMGKVGQFAEWVTTGLFVTQDMKNKAIGDLTKNCEYFAYCFIPDTPDSAVGGSILSTYPKIVQDKRQTQLNILTAYHKSGIINTTQAMGVVESAIKAKYGKTIAEFFAMIRNKEVPALGSVNAIGFDIFSMVGIIKTILDVIRKIFGGKATTVPSDPQVQEAVPAFTDFQNDQKSNDLVTYLPYIAAGGIALFFAMSGKSK
jgi:hypothetical protein